MNETEATSGVAPLPSVRPAFDRPAFDRPVFEWGLWPSSWTWKRPRLGLPGKLLVLTALFVLLAEILIFVPSIASFRINWLNDRLTAAMVSALAAEAVPSREVPPALRNELLRTALVRAIAIRRGGARRLVLPPVQEIGEFTSFDLREVPRLTFRQDIAMRLSQIRDALGVFTAPEDRMIRVVGLLGPRFDDIIDIMMPEEPLRRAMTRYGLNIFWLSILIALLTGALVYFAINSLLVKPMMRLSKNMVEFGENPEDASRIIAPSGRGDEIGLAENELAQMQRQLSQLLLQRNRLAQLGLAVSKINHDLRNMLANAQLISDRLTSIEDPTVQRFAPKLIASLDRAINFCNDTLKFGRAEEAEPRRDLMRLRAIVEEAGDQLGVLRGSSISWDIEMDEGLRIDADREHLFRILSNLGRNAIQAIESQGETVRGIIRTKAWRDGRKVFVEMHDNGPGVPPAARAKLFQAFQGSTKKGGTGLGLSIAAELVAAHGGTLKLLDIDKGATFLLEIPDRSPK